MVNEMEIKLRIPDGRLIDRIREDRRVRACLLAEFRPISMEAVYYDTPAGDLSARKWSLRLRVEAGRPVAACKTLEERDGALFSRQEWQIPAQTLEAAIPLLIEQGAPEELALYRDYEPRCEILFTRLAAPLRLEDGSTVEMAIDSGRLQADGKSEPLRELELELLTGLPAKMLELASYLETTYALPHELSSKYARALRLVRSR